MTAAPDRNARLAAVAVPAAAAAGLYALTMGHGFAFDDPIAVSSNPLVTGELPASEALTRSFWADRPGFDHLPSWRPLTLWSLRLDHALGAGAAGAFHVTNIVLHALVAALVAALPLRLGATARVAGLAGLTMAWGSAGAEAVASVVGRGDLLATAFGVLALHLTLPPRGRPVSVWAAVPLALALMAKESALIWAVPVVGMALWPRARLAPALAAVAAVVGWALVRSAVVGGGGPVSPLDNPTAGLPLADRLLPGLGAIGHMATWLAWPSAIAPDYAAGVDLAKGWAVLAAALALAAGLAKGVWLLGAVRRDSESAARWPPLALAATAALGAFWVASSGILVPLPTPLAGRLAYGALAAWALLVASGLWAVADTRPAAARAAGLLVGAWALAHGAVALGTAQAWADDASLFAFGVEVEPTSARARANHARQELRAGRPGSAEAHLREALSAAPGHPVALTNLTLALQAQGKHDEAWDTAQEAAAAEREHSRPGKALANLCALAFDRPPEIVSAEVVVEACAAAAAALPGAVEPAINRARALARAGRTQDADAQFERVLGGAPTSAFALGHRVGFLRAQGRHAESVATQEAFVAAHPQDPRGMKNLIGLALEHAGRLEGQGARAEACALMRRVAARAPGVSVVGARVQALCAP